MILYALAGCALWLLVLGWVLCIFLSGHRADNHTESHQQQWAREANARQYERERLGL